MDHRTQVALVRRILAFLDRDTTELAPDPYINPVSSYTSPARLTAEREVLFREQPLLLGLSGDVPQSGSYLAHDDSGIPVLLVRSQTGELQAFLNICRHRGARVASGAAAGAATRRFVCPYHGWTYDDAGRLIAQPCSEAFPRSPDESFDLCRLAVAERHGMIFVRVSGDEPIDVDRHLEGAEDELAVYDLARYVPFDRRVIEKRMNWKLAVDTFLEAHHVSSLHQTTLSPSILGSPAAWDAFGRSGRMVAVRRSISELRDQPDSDWNLLDHAVVLYQLFPNTVVIHQIDHIEIIQSYPVASSADACRIVFSLYTPQPVESARAKRHFQANFDLLLAASEDEDFRLAEQIQQGFWARPDGTVIYGRNEPGLAHYHRMIERELASASPRG